MLGIIPLLPHCSSVVGGRGVERMQSSTWGMDEYVNQLPQQSPSYTSSHSSPSMESTSSGGTVYGDVLTLQESAEEGEACSGDWVLCDPVGEAKVSVTDVLVDKLLRELKHKHWLSEDQETELKVRTEIKKRLCQLRLAGNYATDKVTVLGKFVWEQAKNQLVELATGEGVAQETATQADGVILLSDGRKYTSKQPPIIILPIKK